MYRNQCPRMFKDGCALGGVYFHIIVDQKSIYLSFKTIMLVGSAFEAFKNCKCKPKIKQTVIA